MKKRFGIINVFIALLLVLCMAGCSQNNVDVQSNTQNDVENDVAQKKLKIVTTLFPQYDFAKQVGGDLVDVTLILPAGVEAHSYEPTPQDIVDIEQADLFIYTGEHMEPWAHKIIEGLDAKNVRVVDVSEGIELLASEHHSHAHEDAHEQGHEEKHSHEDEHEEDHDHGDKHEDEHEEDHDHGDKHEDEHEEKHEHHHDGVDPHIWLNPMNAMIMVDNITYALCDVSSENSKTFIDNANEYKDQLAQLDTDFKDVFKNTTTHTIVSGGHFAFGYFVDYYGLEFVSPYKGFSPDAEPTPKEVISLIEFIKDNDIKAIYYEELVDPKVANTIANETDVQMYQLHAAHNISKDDKNKGVTYISIMRDNMENLKKGMGYKK